MSNLTPEEIVKALGNMSVMELITLTKELEQKWGVSATPQVTTTVQMPGTNDETAVAQTEFTVVLASFAADKKMAVVKAVRELTGLGLLESKQLVEGAPKTVKDGLSKADAEDLKNKLTEAGAVIELK